MLESVGIWRNMLESVGKWGIYRNLWTLWGSVGVWMNMSEFVGMSDFVGNCRNVGISRTQSEFVWISRNLSTMSESVEISRNMSEFVGLSTQFVAIYRNMSDSPNISELFEILPTFSLSVCPELPMNYTEFLVFLPTHSDLFWLSFEFSKHCSHFTINTFSFFLNLRRR